MSNFRQTLRTLAVALDVPVDTRWNDVVELKLAEDELETSSPPWLGELLDAFATKTVTPEWVPFEVVGLESSGAFDFLRTLDRILPVAIHDEGERYTVVAKGIGLEAIVAFEGYLWLVKPIGSPEPG